LLDLKFKKMHKLRFEGGSTPQLLISSYLIFGFVLFLIAPFNWNIENWIFLSIYFCLMIIMLTIGFQSRLHNVIFVSAPVNYKYAILMGTACTMAMLVPTTLLYSGKYPWQLAELLANQSEAYLTYQEKLRASTSSDRAPVAIFRAILHPLVFAVLPLTIIHWNKLSSLLRLCAVIVIVSAIITSLARGTDRETSDIILLVFSSWLVAYFRKKNNSTENFELQKKSKNYTKKSLLAVMFFISMISAYAFFVERKLARYNGNFFAACVGSDQDICLTNAAVNMSWVGDWGIFAIGITAGYMSAGYYGLNLAMGLDFQSTYGTGFSPLVVRFYESLTGDSSMYLNSYTYRMRALGWSDEYTWSTLMVWFANDVGFFGALIVLFFLSMLFGAAWRDAVLAKDDRAAIVFVLLFIMFIYLPANNQIGQTLDLSFAFLFWLFCWQFFKRRPQMIFASPKLSHKTNSKWR
jgi:hypothetical protein